MTENTGIPVNRANAVEIDDEELIEQAQQTREMFENMAVLARSMFGISAENTEALCNLGVDMSNFNDQLERQREIDLLNNRNRLIRNSYYGLPNNMPVEPRTESREDDKPLERAMARHYGISYHEAHQIVQNNLRSGYLRQTELSRIENRIKRAENVNEIDEILRDFENITSMPWAIYDDPLVKRIKKDLTNNFKMFSKRADELSGRIFPEDHPQYIDDNSDYSEPVMNI